MKRRAFFVTFVGTILTGVFVGLAVCIIVTDFSYVATAMLLAGFVGLLLAPVAAVLAIFVFSRTERWVQKDHADDSRARRAYRLTGAILLPTYVVLALAIIALTDDGGDASALGIAIGVVLIATIAAAVGAVGGSLIAQGRATTPAATT